MVPALAVRARLLAPLRDSDMPVPLPRPPAALQRFSRCSHSARLCGCVSTISRAAILRPAIASVLALLHALLHMRSLPPITGRHILPVASPRWVGGWIRITLAPRITSAPSRRAWRPPDRRTADAASCRAHSRAAVLMWMEERRKLFRPFSLLLSKLHAAAVALALNF